MWLKCFVYRLKTTLPPASRRISGVLRKYGTSVDGQIAILMQAVVAFLFCRSIVHTADFTDANESFIKLTATTIRIPKPLSTNKASV